MANATFAAERAADAPEGVSFAYYELLDFVESRYSHLEAEARRLIFAVAYSLYCKEKKNSIAIHRSKGSPANGDVIRSCYVSLASPAAYERFCDEAREIVNQSFKKLGAVGLDVAVAKISDAIEQREKITIINILRETVRHFVVIILVAILVGFVAYILDDWKSIVKYVKDDAKLPQLHKQ